jgi:aerobic carbon-monoxide dehydrogenase medium subunit
MIPAAFEYHRPSTLQDAVALLGRLGDGAKVLAGGQSLIPLMKLRLVSPRHVVDLNRISGLGAIAEQGGTLVIGALVRESELEASELVRRRFPILADACRVIADPLVRNLATVGGNLAHGDPANDHPAAMLALGAEVVAVGPKGTRRLPLDGFFTGPLETALGSGEILTEIRIPLPAPRSGGAYLKVERKVGDFATAAVGAQITLAGGDACTHAGIGLTNVGPTPIRARRAEALLKGRRLDDAAIREAAIAAASESDPSEDLRGSVAYKRDLVRVLTARALRRALERAGADH